MRDGRKVDGLSLNVNSFEFVNHETSLSTEDFYEEGQKEVKETYYAEIAELMKKHTGAAYVHIFHHQVRNKEKANGNVQNLNTSVQGYANGVHRSFGIFFINFLVQKIINFFITVILLKKELRRHFCIILNLMRYSKITNLVDFYI